MCTVTSKLNVTLKRVCLPILKLLLILAVASQITQIDTCEGNGHFAGDGGYIRSYILTFFYKVKINLYFVDCWFLSFGCS